jgi:serine/threonine protein phosphatase PrpC
VTSGSNSQRFEVASRTHPGLVREANEDHCATFCDGECAGLVVADGVSGLQGGHEASRIAVQRTVEAFCAEPRSVRPAKRLYRAVQRANIAVHDLALAVPELSGMATTLTAVVLVSGELFSVHIGDCRLYLYRDGRLLQLSKDHTVAGERVRLGLLSKTRAKHHPGRSTLTRGLGRELIARVDQISTRVAEHDVLVVCSDGIHGLVDDTEIAGLCGLPSAEALCEALIGAANARGSPDNVTAAVARVTGAPPSGARGRSLSERLFRTRGA